MTQYYGLRIWQDLLVFVHFHTDLPVTDGLSLYWRLCGAVFRWLVTMLLVSKALVGADSTTSASTIFVFLCIVIGSVGVPAAIVGLLSRSCERAYERRKAGSSKRRSKRRQRREDDDAVVKESARDLKKKATRRGRAREE